MFVKIFQVRGHTEIDRLESTINEWLKSLPGTAIVEHMHTAMSEHENIEPLFVVTLVCKVRA